MNVRDYISLIRERMSDTEEPYMVSDPALLLYVQAAEDDMAFETRQFVSSSQPFCTIELLQGQSEADLSDRIITVRGAINVTTQAPLDVNEHEFYESQLLLTSTPADICSVYIDTSENKLRATAPARVDTTILLSVEHYPPKRPYVPTDDMALPDDQLLALINHILYYIYSGEDTELAAESPDTYEARYQRDLIRFKRRVTRKRHKRTRTVTPSW
jgi:hypothetical protein